MNINIRSFTAEDLMVITCLINKEYSETYEFIPQSENELHLRIQQENARILVAESKGQVLGVVVLRETIWVEEISWFAVEEVKDKIAIKNALVMEIEKYAKGTEVFTTVNSESPKIEDWIGRGYYAKDGLYHMIAKIDSVKPIPKIPEGFTLRSLTREEEKQFVNVVNSSFGFERLKAGIIQRWKNEFPSFNEEWTHVAEANGDIVSAVVSMPDMKYNEYFKSKIGYLGLAATILEHRGKGLASALTTRALNILYMQGYNSAALYITERNTHSINLLKNLGFQISHH